MVYISLDPLLTSLYIARKTGNRCSDLLKTFKHNGNTLYIRYKQSLYNSNTLKGQYLV